MNASVRFPLMLSALLLVLSAADPAAANGSDA